MLMEYSPQLANYAVYWLWFKVGITQFTLLSCFIFLLSVVDLSIKGKSVFNDGIGSRPISENFSVWNI